MGWCVCVFFKFLINYTEMNQKVIHNKSDINKHNMSVVEIKLT